MKVRFKVGKGGVGKTQCAVAVGVFLATKGEKVAIVDNDGGHSVQRTLGWEKPIPCNTIHEVIPNLSVVIIENTRYVGIMESRELEWSVPRYLEQFPDDQGLLPLADMINAFFGVPTDVVTLQKFATLVTILLKLEAEGFDTVIVDVEPTAGFERLISNARSTVRSLRNLSRQGVISLKVIGAKWPDIAHYLRGDYIKNADLYCTRIEKVLREWIVGGHYSIVATPEASPISQTSEVRTIISQFGGTVRGYIVNNLRGESYEEGNIARLESENLPIVRILRRPELHDGDTARLPVLIGIGGQIMRQLP